MLLDVQKWISAGIVHGATMRDAPCILLLNSKALNRMHATELPTIGGRPPGSLSPVCVLSNREEKFFEGMTEESWRPLGKLPEAVCTVFCCLLRALKSAGFSESFQVSRVTVAVLPSGNPLILVAHCIAACSQNLIINSEDMNKSLPFILGSEKYLFKSTLNKYF